MLNRLSASLGLAFAFFVASTGVSSAAAIEIDSRNEVMYLAGAIAIGFVVLTTLIYAVKVALGAEKNEPENPELEDELHIRSSGYGGEYYDQRYGGEHGGHDSHGNGHETATAHAAHGAATTSGHGAATAVAERPAAVAESSFGPGSALPLADGSAPAGFSIKGNADSMLYHTPESPSYEVTIAEVWFESEDAARNAGFSRWDTNQ